MGNENHLFTKHLDKALIIARQVRIWHRILRWYNTSTNIWLQRTLLCKALCNGEIGQGKWLRKSLVNIPTHPPLHYNEEELEGFGLWKEEVQTLWKFWKVSSLSLSLSLSLYTLFLPCHIINTELSKFNLWRVSTLGFKRVLPNYCPP